MMHLVIADSELEMIPDEIRNHPSVRMGHNRILDSSLHHSAMEKIPDGRRRGRPDIVHITLLIASESILNREGKLRIYIHTRNNEVIYIKPETRIIKNYNRFKGLMHQLFEHGKVPPKGEKLMEIKKEDLDTLIKKLPGKKILFSEEGKRKEIREVMERDAVCIIGGFPHGDFISPVHEMVDEIISIYHEPLPSWTVAMEAIACYENKFISPIP